MILKYRKFLILISLIALFFTWYTTQNIRKNNKNRTKNINTFAKYLSKHNEKKLYLLRLDKISKVPNPITSTYKDCLVICLATISSIENNKIVSHDKVIISLNAFINRKLTSFKKVKVGDYIITTLTPYEKLSKNIKARQSSDTLNLDYYDNYFHCKFWQKIQQNNIFLIKNYYKLNFLSSIFLNDKKEKEGVKRKPKIKIRYDKVYERINRHIDKIENLVTKNKGWTNWFKLSQKVRINHFKNSKDTKGRYYSKDIFTYKTSLLNSYKRGAKDLENFPAAQNLISLHNNLKAMDKHLIVVMFPYMSEVTFKYQFPNSKLSSDIICPERQKIIYYLLKKGVDVIDILPELLKYKASENSFYECCGDGHPSNNAIISTAKYLGDILKSYKVIDRIHPYPTIFKEYIFSEKYTTRQDEPFPKNKIQKANIIQNDYFNKLELDNTILLTGDSYTQVPVQYGLHNASIYHHLSGTLNRKISYLYQEGGANKIFQNLRLNSELLHNSNLIIFIVSPFHYINNSIQWDENKPNNIYENGSLFN